MEIKQPQLISPKISQESTKKAERASNNNFNAIFKEAVGETTAAPLNKPTAPIHFKDPLASIQFQNRIENKDVSDINQVENFVDTLESYQKKLKNPTVNMESISPLINTMARENEKMMALYKSMSDRTELKQILNKTLVLSSVEIAKYYRGDYF